MLIKDPDSNSIELMEYTPAACNPEVTVGWSGRSRFRESTGELWHGQRRAGASEALIRPRSPRYSSRS